MKTIDEIKEAATIQDDDGNDVVDAEKVINLLAEELRRFNPDQPTALFADLQGFIRTFLDTMAGVFAFMASVGGLGQSVDDAMMQLQTKLVYHQMLALYAIVLQSQKKGLIVAATLPPEGDGAPAKGPK